MGQGGAWGCQVPFPLAPVPCHISQGSFCTFCFLLQSSVLQPSFNTHEAPAYIPCCCLHTFLLTSVPCHLSIQAFICRNGTAENSLQKLHLILQLCRELGIHTSAAKLGRLCIVPLLSWHHSSWDTEPDIQGVPHVSALSIADYGACCWPQSGPGMNSEQAAVDNNRVCMCDAVPSVLVCL